MSAVHHIHKAHQHNYFDSLFHYSSTHIYNVYIYNIIYTYATDSEMNRLVCDVWNMTLAIDNIALVWKKYLSTKKKITNKLINKT